MFTAEPTPTTCSSELYHVVDSLAFVAAPDNG
uniref:Uncharacterized protein n=1 Tax=Anguilla anguilla TaxID=7936 RepID=A0A0E9SI26_ANGAN